MCIPEKNILPINSEKFEGIYDSNVFFNCICSSKDRIGMMSSALEVKNYSDYLWHSSFMNISFSSDKDRIHLSSQCKNDENMSGCIYRMLQENDEFCIKLEDPHYTTVNLNKYIVLGIDDTYKTNSDVKANKHSWILKFTYHTLLGTLLWEDDVKKECKNYMWNAFPVYLKICAMGEVFQLLASPDGIHYYICTETRIKRPDNLFIGVYFEQDENQWVNWKMLNNIQLVYDTKSHKLDYFFRVEKNEKTNLVNQFVDYLYFYTDAIKEYTGLDKFITSNINIGRYCSLLIFNEHTESNENILIYGYDNIHSEYYVVRQGNNQNWTTGKIPYDKMNILQNSIITLLEYKLHAIFYFFKPEFFKAALSEYINSYKSNHKLEMIMPQNKSHEFGISVYKYILSGDLHQNSNNLKLLKEHAMRWTDIVYFLKHKNIAITDEQFQLADKMREFYAGINFSRLVDPQYQENIKIELEKSIDIEKKIVKGIIELL